jgi:Xaa-Pro aminopeptidase
MKTRSSRSIDPEILLYADSESDADMLYFGGVFVPDPFIAFSCRGRRVAVVSRLEFARVCREGKFDEVLSLEKAIEDAVNTAPGPFGFPAGLIAFLARKFKIRSFKVSETFPCGPAFALRELGMKIEVADGMLLPERSRKTDREALLIREGNEASSAGFRVAEKLLRDAEIRRGYLYHSGRRLTSERVQEAIAVECLKRGAIAANTIVAGGDQACDPHCRGSGPLRANEWTYLKGKATEAQKALHAAVLEAEQWAIGEHRSGKSGSRIYQSVLEGFEKKGYPTGSDGDVPVGFIHGLGHGLGLAVHEPPRVNAARSVLKKGQVITVEPGLYYPGLGGVRIEDVVRVAAGVPEMLSRHSYRWQIR